MKLLLKHQHLILMKILALKVFKSCSTSLIDLLHCAACLNMRMRGISTDISDSCERCLFKAYNI